MLDPVGQYLWDNPPKEDPITGRFIITTPPGACRLFLNHETGGFDSDDQTGEGLVISSRPLEWHVKRVADPEPDILAYAHRHRHQVRVLS